MARPWTRTPAVIAALFFACAAPASAADINVTSTADAGDSSVGNGVCDSAVGCTLRAAVQTANDASAPGPDVIHVPAGVYQLLEDPLSITSPITIVGSGARVTTIRGGGLDGVIHIAPASAGDPVSISDLTITGGTAQDGGGIQSQNARLALTRVAVTDNRALHEGGGGMQIGSGTLTMSDSVVAGNHAAMGGAGIDGLEDVPITLTNVTVSGNEASGGSPTGGGGLVLRNDATLTNVTVANNTGDLGAGIFIQNVPPHTYVFKNTIVAGNHSGLGVDCDFADMGPSPTSGGHNISGTDTCNFHDPTDRTAADPQLLPLANNGGSTDTMGLPGTSPAINAGDTAACPPFDQRGVARLGACDIGAFEFIPPPVTTPPAVDRTKPRLRLARLKAESIRHALFVFVTPNEASTVSVKGSVSVPKLAKVYRLKGSKRKIAADKRGKLTLKITKRAKAKIRRALRHHKKLKAKITITAKDAAGNTTVTRRKIRLKR